MVYKIEFKCGTIEEDNETISFHFRSKCYDNLTEGSISNHIMSVIQKLNSYWGKLFA